MNRIFELEKDGQGGGFKGIAAARGSVEVGGQSR